MAKKLNIVLHSDYSLETCLAKLAEQVDLDQRTLFSLSGYRGNKPILGRIEGNSFRLFKRRYWHNSFAPVLFGRMNRDGRGTVVEGYWETWRSVRIFMRIWLVLVVLIGTPAFFGFLWYALSDKGIDRQNLWLGFVVPPALILWGLLLPRVGAGLSFHERKPIVELLERTLVARKEVVSAQERSWESSLDTFDLWV